MPLPLQAKPEVPVSEVTVRKKLIHFENKPIRQIYLNQVSKQHLRCNFLKVFTAAFFK